MKKIKFLIFTFLFVILGSTNVYANDYSIEDYSVYININSDGSAKYEERLTFDFRYNANGIYHDIDYRGYGEIENLQVFVLDNGFEKEFKNNSSENVGTYTASNYDDILSLKVFEKTNYASKTFIFKYTLPNAVTLYNDTGEFYKFVLPKNIDVNVDNFYTEISFSENINKDNLKVFAHGPLHGDISPTDDGKVIIKVVDLFPNESVETRILFPKSAAPYGTKIINENAYDKIMNEELNLADEADKEREEVKQQIEAEEKFNNLKKMFSNIGALIIGALGGIFYIPKVLKNIKLPKTEFDGEYYRELPGDYTPAETAYLIEKKVPSENILATLLNLVRKGYLKMDSIPIEQKKSSIFFGSKNQDEDDLCFTIINNDFKNLKSHEKFLLKWLFEDLGDSESRFFISNIEKAGKNNAMVKNFSSKYNRWVGDATLNGKKNAFYESDTNKKSSSVINIGSLISTIGIIVCLFLGLFPIVIVFGGFLAFSIFASVKVSNKRTSYGQEDFVKWMALKKFLNDFSAMKTYEAQSIVIWEYYLVYAVTLGVADKVLEAMPKVFTINDLQKEDSRIFRTYGYTDYNYMNRRLLYNISRVNQNVNRNIQRANTIISEEQARERARQISNSRPSSRGGGGGFSGGGGGGGGGRGGSGGF